MLTRVTKEGCLDSKQWNSGRASHCYSICMVNLVLLVISTVRTVYTTPSSPVYTSRYRVSNNNSELECLRLVFEFSLSHYGFYHCFVCEKRIELRFEQFAFNVILSYYAHWRESKVSSFWIVHSTQPML